MHVLDIMGNSIRAGARFMELTVTENMSANTYAMTFRDNGCGMSKTLLSKVLDPWYTSRKERRVGLGLSLLKQNAEMCGGSLMLKSTPGLDGEGETVLEVVFQHDHVDRPVAGDMAVSFMIMVSSWPDREFVYTHQTDHGEYQFDTREVKEFLEGIPINHPEMIASLTEMIGENLKEIQAEQPYPVGTIEHVYK